MITPFLREGIIEPQPYNTTVRMVSIESFESFVFQARTQHAFDKYAAQFEHASNEKLAKMRFCSFFHVQSQKKSAISSVIFLLLVGLLVTVEISMTINIMDKKALLP